MCSFKEEKETIEQAFDCRASGMVVMEMIMGSQTQWQINGLMQ